jgi:hypothetical protein
LIAAEREVLGTGLAFASRRGQHADAERQQSEEERGRSFV